MTRFANLEFDESQPEQQTVTPQHQRAPQGVITDDFHYLKLAEDQYLLGQFEAALKLYSRALSHNPNNADGWVGQLRMLIELGELKEARIWGSKSLEIFRNQPDLLSLQGVAHCRLGDRAKALQFSDSAFEQLGAGSFFMWLSRGEILLAAKGKQAEFAMDKAATMPGFAEWFRLLLVARVYYFHRMYCRAIQKVREATDLKMDSPFAWHLMGNCQEAMKQYKRAEASYREAMSLYPDYPASKAALHGLSGLGFFKRMFA
jgi:tetratricopeptide (TPR) repeat protein